MGDEPGRYWDFREGRWVRYEAPRPEVPLQPAAIEDEQVVTAPEADVRSG